MSFTRYVGLALAGMLLAATASTTLLGQGDTPSDQKTEKTMKKVPISHSKPESGAQMWKDYCAACHGTSGAGDGPAGEILKSPPADLSLLARQNNGKFPAGHFASVLKFGSGGHAHGTSDMPLWGSMFRSQGASQGVVDLRIHNLTEFVESLQQK
jgi:mono/diheme cytochrome c family protein